MQVRIFSIPIPGGEVQNEEMNVFLRSKKVLHVENQLVQHSHGAFWCFCVKYLDSPVNTSARSRIDYKEVLNEASFARFSKMREIRKQIAQKEGIPAYAVFTNEELSLLAKKEELSLANMKSIKGIGQKKLEKYGTHFIMKKIPDRDETSQ